MPASPEALLFDLDGVLVDSRAAITASINHALERMGLPRQPETSLHRFIGPPLGAALGTLLDELGADPAQAPRAVALYRERYREHCVAETPLFPGIREALTALRGRVPLAVATSKPTAFARPILEARGIAELFDCIEGPSLDPDGEPKERTVARALEGLGMRPVPPGRVVLVGDRRHDVEAARAHGLLPVGVAWGIGSEEELRRAGAARILREPADLVGLLAPDSSSGVPAKLGGRAL